MKQITINGDPAKATFSPATGAYYVADGEAFALLVTPATGYKVASIWDGSVGVASITEYRIPSVVADVELSVSFEVGTQPTVTLTPTYNSGGALSPSVPATVLYGRWQSFVPAADSGYFLKDVLVGTVSQGPVSSYTFEQATLDQTITATFESLGNVENTLVLKRGQTSNWEGVSIKYGEAVIDRTKHCLYVNDDRSLAEKPATNCLAAWLYSSPASGEGIPEAPEDGTAYGRKDAAWVQVSTTGSEYTLPTASAATLGGVKIGEGVTITDGVISVATGMAEQVNSDWTAATGVASILNKPSLGTVATWDVGTATNNIIQLDASAKLPAVDGSELINVGLTVETNTTISVKASEQLRRGQAVYILPGAASQPDVAKCDNTVSTKSRVLGLCVSDIASGAVGSVRRQGVLNGVDTRRTSDGGNGYVQGDEVWAEGDLLFATTGGKLTNVRPTSGRCVKVGYSVKGNSISDNIVVFPMENPVWVTCASGENVVLRLGDAAGANVVSIRDYADVEVASINSDGKFTGDGSGLTGITVASATPVAHNLIDTTGHPVSGLTTGHFLKATGATTYGFGAHGLTASDVGAATTSTKLDDFGTPDDNTDLDATTERHGLLPKLGGGTTNFLRADGTWAAAGGGSSIGWTAETAFTATPASTSTLTMTSDKTASIKVGMAVKYTISSVVYYGVITAITSNLMTIAGAPMGGDVTALYYSTNPAQVVQADFYVPGRFADAANTGLLASDAKVKFDWNLQEARLVQIRHTVSVDDSGANQPRVNMSVGGSAVSTSNTNAGVAVAETWSSTVVDINTTNYVVARDAAIEVVTDANGSNDDATDLTVSGIFVVI